MYIHQRVSELWLPQRRVSQGRQSLWEDCIKNGYIATTEKVQFSFPKLTNF